MEKSSWQCSSLAPCCTTTLPHILGAWMHVSLFSPVVELILHGLGTFQYTSSLKLRRIEESVKESGGCVCQCAE